MNVKNNQKIIFIVSGVVFLFLAGKELLLRFINSIGYLSYYRTSYLLIAGCSIMVLIILGAFALLQRKRPVAVSILGLVYILYCAYNTIRGIFYLAFAASLKSVLYLALLIAAFVCTELAGRGSVFDLRDTRSEAAKTRIQADKQIAVYGDLLSCGAITQEEYDQLTKNRSM